MVASKKELLILDTLLKDIRRVKKSSNLNTFFSKRVFKHKKSSKKTRKFDSFFCNRKLFKFLFFNLFFLNLIPKQNKKI